MPQTYECNEDGCTITGCSDCEEELCEEDMHYCSSDFNCSDFTTQAEAQAFYEQILTEVGYDVYRLDADKDCIACEHLK